MLEVSGLVKSYRRRGNEPVHAVSNVGFNLARGEILAFLGPNGAGKTTTIKMIAGLIRPDHGDVHICGHSMAHRRRRALQHVGAVLEGSRNLYWRMTPMENFLYWGGIKGMRREQVERRGKELLDIFGLAHKDKDTVQKLSRGMQQQIAICTALLHEPELLLLDEPTLGLDLEASDRVQHVVTALARDTGVGIVLTTHQMEVAEQLADRVCIIRQGKIVLAGKTQDVLATFGRDMYLLELEVDVDEAVRQELKTEGVEWINARSCRIACNSARPPHEWLQRLSAYPFVRMERERADLADVFRHVTREEMRV